MTEKANPNVENKKPINGDKKQAQKEEKKEQQPEQKVDESKELKEKLLRLAAEFDNYKKRMQKDLDESATIGKATMVKQMLPIIDEFELALIASEKSEDKNLAKGMAMLYSNLMDMLTKNGLKEIKCEGVFDPFRHEIIMVRESEKKEGTILEVMKKGYEFSGKMLRPASVIVAKQIAKSGAKEQNNVDK